MNNAGKDPCGTRFGSDAALIEAVRSGDREAIGCLYRLLYRASFPSVRKLVKERRGSVEDAEDLFQESFLTFRRKILDGSYQYQKKAAISTYFYEVFRYKWQDELKSARRNRTESKEDPQWQSPDERKDEGLIKEERTRMIRKAIQKLGEPCLTLLTDYVWHKWDLESIANKLGITPESAKNQKYRCMKRLKAYFLENQDLQSI